MFVLDLTVEKWVGNKNELQLIENPDWSQIKQAICELDGKSKTSVTLGIDDTYMIIGGGETGKYIVSVTRDNTSFYNLIEPSKPDVIEKQVVGGQESIYSANMCVDINTAFLAAKTFAESGELEASVCWREEKSLVVM